MSKKFFLRPLKQEDAPRMLEWMKNPDVMRYLRINGDKMTIEDVQDFIQRSSDETQNIHRAVTSEDDRYYGTLSLKNIDRQRGDAEYAISLHQDGIGTGAAVSCSKELLQTAFSDLGLRRVYLNVLEENRRAIKLYQKLGFNYLGSTQTEFKGNGHAVLRWYEIKSPYTDDNDTRGQIKAMMKELTFRENGDERGKLVVVEGNSDIPFSISRIFYIYGADGESVRGCHANRKTEFVLINVSGSSKVRVMDGTNEYQFTLDKPNKGVYLPKMTWKEMYDFSPDAVLLCLASEIYDPEEYIRDYAEFVEETKRYE